MSDLALLTEVDYDSLLADATMWRYLRDNAPPEGCIVKFDRTPGLTPMSSITWGVPFSEKDGDELVEALRAAEAELVATIRNDHETLRNPAPEAENATVLTLRALLAKYPR